MKLFEDYLTDIKKPNRPNLGWDVEGIIKDRTNQPFKFDLKPIRNIKGILGKEGNFNKKADKMVFEYSDKYIVLDIEELNNYVKTYKLKIVQMKELLEKLEWNIILKK